MFLSTGCSLLRAEGFSCSLCVLYGDLGISKLQFLIKKIKIKFPAINFFQFSVIKPWIRIRDPDPQLEKMLDPGRIRIRIKSMRIRNPACNYIDLLVCEKLNGATVSLCKSDCSMNSLQSPNLYTF
jgi:hypothetical protein